MRRFSIRSLIAFVVVSAIGLAALRDGWAGILLLLIVLILAAVGMKSASDLPEKAFTSWNNQNAEYEEAVTGFARALLADGEFLADLKAFVGPLVEPGRVNSRAQTLIKVTAPGVPDIYQGTELWTLSLVVPDNRRPVDYETRRRLLAELEGATVESIVRRSDEGRTKLHLTRRALHLRRRRPEWFGPDGDYTPLEAEGPKAQHVVAFGRGRGPDCVAVAPRLPIRLGGSGMARPLLSLSDAGSTS